MNKLIATLLATSVLSLMAVPAMAVDTSISAKCGPDGAEVYKRPGGFCEQVGANKSQASEKGEGYQYIIIWDII
jgi:hypothetical protein